MGCGAAEIARETSAGQPEHANGIPFRPGLTPIKSDSLAQSGTLNDLKSLAGKSFVYGAGSILLRALNFILLPLYTRFLTPSDYGIITVTTMVIAVLCIVFPLSLHGALARFYFDASDEVARKRVAGTLSLSILVTALCGVLILDFLGPIVFPLLFREVPFSPYLRLAIWTAFFSTLSLLPLTLLQVQERPGTFVLYSAAGMLLNIGLVIWCVVFLRWGAFGYLLGGLVANGFMVVPYLALMWRSAQVSRQWSMLRSVLVYSLPLVPHGLAAWVLDLSDRAILEHYVTLADLGLYGIGYQLGSAMGMAGAAINYAWVPFIFRIYAESGENAAQRVSRLSTYYALVLVWFALGLGLLGKDLLLLLTPPSYQAAQHVIPWVVAGMLLNGLYHIPITLLFVKAKTNWVPMVTALSCLVNIGLNLWLVPSHGIIAAAWATFAAYGVMLFLAWAVSQRLYSFPYDYRRLLLIGLAGIGLLWAGSIPDLSSLWMEALVRASVWLLFPMVLFAVGFLTPGEKDQARQMVHSVSVSLRRTAERMWS